MIKICNFNAALQIISALAICLKPSPRLAYREVMSPLDNRCEFNLGGFYWQHDVLLSLCLGGVG